MYGTVARLRLKAGRLDDVIALWEEWDRKFRPTVDGAERGFLYRLDEDSNELILVSMFRDKKSYVSNADSPEQDEWYRRFRECLDAEPEWNDGEVVATSG